MLAYSRRSVTLFCAAAVLLFALWLPPVAAAAEDDELCERYSLLLGMNLSDITEAIAAGPDNCLKYDYLDDEGIWPPECRSSYSIAHRCSQDVNILYLKWLEHKCDEDHCISLKYQGDYQAAETSAIPRRFLCD